MRSGFPYGSGVSSTCFTTPNSVVVAPMPNARVIVAIAVKPARRRSDRAAKRTSFQPS